MHNPKPILKSLIDAAHTEKSPKEKAFEILKILEGELERDDKVALYVKEDSSFKKWVVCESGEDLFADRVEIEKDLYERLLREDKISIKTPTPFINAHLIYNVYIYPLRYGGLFFGVFVVVCQNEISLEKEITFDAARKELSNIVKEELLKEELVCEREIEIRDKIIRDLTVVCEMSSTITSILETEELFYMVLFVLTMEEGFGFDRAALFMLDKSSNRLKGVVGIEPKSLYSKVLKKFETGDEKPKLKTSVNFFLNNRKIFDELPLNKVIKSIELPLGDEKSAISLAISKKEPIIADGKSDPILRKKIGEKIDVDILVIVPLISKTELLGIIILDNYYTKRPIRAEDLRVLEMFVRHAAMVIENANLYKELKESNRLLRETQRKLMHAEKMAVVGEVSAMVAHEIKNPLIAIGGFAKKLDRKLENSSLKRYTKIIIDEIERLEEVLKDILDYSRELHLNFEDADLNSVICEALSMFREEFKKYNIKVIKDLSDEIGILRIDTNRIKQVFINLFSNAAQAMEAGGTLTIRSYTKGDTVTVEVEDTGCGLEEKMLSNLFKPFFTTKKDGVGLGLSVVKKIIDGHGGDIKAKINDRGGMTFIINLPMEVKHGKDSRS